MMSTDPGIIKKIGNKLETNELWRSKSHEVMLKGLMAKFSQNQDLLKTLKETHPLQLVECSPADKIWANGLTLQDTLSGETPWKGTNALGKYLVTVRDSL